MYFEYIYTVAAIVAVVKASILAVVIITLVKILASMHKVAQEEKTDRLAYTQEDCNCEFCGIEHKEEQ
jgi:hypothetical protein